MGFLSLIFGEWVFKPYSGLVAMILRIKGVKVGRNFKILGVPQLRIKGGRGSIQIGDNVFIKGSIDLRTGVNGKILIKNNVAIDTTCRFIAANDAIITIEEGADLGAFLICNGGTDIHIGKDVLMAGFCYLQSSNHGVVRGVPIKEQPHSYSPIKVGDNSWLAGHVSVLAGVTIGSGAVVGAHSVVTKNIDEDMIVAGIPAKKIRVRAK